MVLKLSCTQNDKIINVNTRKINHKNFERLVKSNIDI